MGNSNCDCCEGVESITPEPISNRPGLDAIDYRVGTHGSFKRAMKAAIARAPALSGLTTLLLASFAIRFDVFDGTLGRTLVGNLAFIGFGQVPGGIILYWAYQILAVGLLSAASMTAYQDLQAMAWRNVAIGEIPEVVVADRGIQAPEIPVAVGTAGR